MTDQPLGLNQFIARARVMYAFLPDDDDRTCNQYVADELIAAGLINLDKLENLT